MKDGRTHRAHKAEHAVDLETGAVVAVTVAAGDAGDTATILETLPQAGEHIAAVACATNNEAVGERVHPEGPVDAVGDKGYHSNDTLQALREVEVRTYISEPESWTPLLEGQARSTASGLRQPTTYSRQTRKRTVATARGVSGTQLCACL